MLCGWLCVPMGYDRDEDGSCSSVWEKVDSHQIRLLQYHSSDTGSGREEWTF